MQDQGRTSPHSQPTCTTLMFTWTSAAATAGLPHAQVRVAFNGKMCCQYVWSLHTIDSCSANQF
jgi:hypothetical protein